MRSDQTGPIRSVHIHLQVSHSSNPSLYLCRASRPDKTLPTSTYRCHIPQISLSTCAEQADRTTSSVHIHLQVSHSSNLSLYLCGVTRPDNKLRPHPPTGVTLLKSLSLYLCGVTRPDKTLRPHPPTGVTFLKSLSLYLCGVTRPDKTLRPHPPTGVTLLKSLSLYLCGATRPDKTLPTSTYRCHIPQISLSLPVRSDQTGQSTDACIKYCTHETHLFHLYLQLFK